MIHIIDIDTTRKQIRKGKQRKFVELGMGIITKERTQMTDGRSER